MKYKNITKNTLYLPNIGEVKPGETVETSEEINSVNFEFEKTKENNNKTI